MTTSPSATSPPTFSPRPPHHRPSPAVSPTCSRTRRGRRPTLSAVVSPGSQRRPRAHEGGSLRRPPGLLARGRATPLRTRETDLGRGGAWRGPGEARYTGRSTGTPWELWGSNGQDMINIESGLSIEFWWGALVWVQVYFFRKRLVNEQVFVSFSPVEPTLVQPCGCSAWGGCQGFRPPEDVGLKP